MTRSEFDEIDPAERAHSMLKTLVVADEDEMCIRDRKNTAVACAR